MNSSGQNKKKWTEFKIKIKWICVQKQKYSQNWVDSQKKNRNIIAKSNWTDFFPFYTCNFCVSVLPVGDRFFVVGVIAVQLWAYKRKQI